MTKPREPETFEDAAWEALTGLGPREVAFLVGRGERAVRAWSDAETDGRPTLHQAVLVDVAHARRFKGRMPFLAAYLHQARKLLTPGPDVGDLLAEALDVPEAVGKLIGIVRRVRGAASAGGAVITAAEHRDIRAALREVRRELDELEAAADAEAVR